MATTPQVPIFPLNTVLFPGGLLPLRVFEARYMDMAREALKQGTPFGVCLIREGQEVGAPAVPSPVGTLARILDCDMQQMGVLLLRTLGTERFRIRTSRVSGQGLIVADIDRLAEPADTTLPSQYGACERLLRAVAASQPTPIFEEPLQFDSARWVSNRLSEVLPLPLSVKQSLLEVDDSLVRLGVLFNFMQQRGLILN